VADSSPLTHWGRRHTIAIAVLSGFFIWMAIALPWGLFTSWIVCVVALSAFSLIVGHGVTGAWKGAFVDDRLRMSLSRVQMLTWTVLIVSAFGVLAIARAQRNAITALDVSVPEPIWLLLGISTASLIGSPLIRDLKKDPAKAPPPPAAEEAVKQQGGDPSKVVVDSQFVRNKSIDQASVADLFMGELVDDFNLLDVAKIQMFLFTLLAVLAYATAIGASLRSGLVPGTLPSVGEGLLAILGISHGGYLMSKAAAAPKAGQP
jgi:hypothetical protein